MIQETLFNIPYYTLPTLNFKVKKKKLTNLLKSYPEKKTGIQPFSTNRQHDRSGFADAFAEARGNRQELFTWQGNKYTTRRADETDQQYQNFLGKSVDNKVVLKEEPYAPADQKEYNNVLAGNAVVDENIIIPKKKPIDWESPK